MGTRRRELERPQGILDQGSLEKPVSRLCSRSGNSIRSDSSFTWEIQATQLAPDIAGLVKPAKSGELFRDRLSGHQAREIARLHHHGGQRRLAEKAMKEGLSGPTLYEVRKAVQEAPDDKTVEKILETPWIRKAEEVIEEIEIEEVREERERREIAEEKKIRWERFPSTKDFLEILRMHQRLIKRGWEAAKDEKIAPDHLHYLTQRMKETVRILQDIIEQMETKALERY